MGFDITLHIPHLQYYSTLTLYLSSHLIAPLHCICPPISPGLDEEGIYRKPGILSKATKLVKDSVERGKLDSIDLTDEFEWDTKTIASAVKGYLGKFLGEPLLTFDLHMAFVEAASECVCVCLCLYVYAIEGVCV